MNAKAIRLTLLTFILAACATPAPTPAPTADLSLAAKSTATPTPIAVNLSPGQSITVNCPTSLTINGKVVICAPLASATPTSNDVATPTRTPAPSNTPVPPTVTPTATITPTLPASATPLPTPTARAQTTPFPAAPLCLDSGEFHDVSLWHGPWNPVSNCHYDHEHGDDAYTPQVASHFPGFDFKLLQGNVEIGHLNPSSPRENAWDGKHGGGKIQVDLDVPCISFESSVNCVTDSIVQYHWFGNMAVEMESRIHSVVAQERICVIANPTDCGIFFGIQFVDLGQRVFQYQGELADYSLLAGCGSIVTSCQPNPEPPYAVNLLSYFTGDRVGGCVGCRASLAFIRDRKLNVNGTWTSKGDDEIGSGSKRIQFLGRDADMYQVKFDSDKAYPFTFWFVCSGADPLVYVPAGCRYTNSTTRLHELAGDFPLAWDTLDGVSDQHLTGQFYLTAFGDMNPSCQVVGTDCFPWKFEHVPLGKWGGALPGSKISNPTCESNPSRNIWFKNGIWLPGGCASADPLAVPSGWIGAQN